MDGLAMITDLVVRYQITSYTWRSKRFTGENGTNATTNASVTKQSGDDQSYTLPDPDTTNLCNTGFIVMYVEGGTVVDYLWRLTGRARLLSHAKPIQARRNGDSTQMPTLTKKTEH